ncbi:hypothetical protein DSM106972_009920 [Dulcicalothrix desertica PCC 7102]|uniref:TPM domain-containing protein n=2 Tax=Dulcicalothrix desertica TaxID=32056 RepID=A0A433VS87_9CYAN|nr:hypothetical protein DSM106972_009920 [Dulcicalothrix desertica PCC 7102]
MANILTSEDKSTINEILTEYEKKTGTEIAVVTVEDTSPSLTPRYFATQLFKYWGIGKKSVNNGILLLVSQAERKVEIITGYGIEAILPNNKVKQIIDSKIIPSFKQHHFSEGTLIGTQALIQALSEDKTFTAVHATIKIWGKPIHHPEYTFFGLLGGLVIAFSCIIALALRPIRLAPNGKSRIYDGTIDGAATCSECGQSMEKVDPQSLISYLNPPEQVAQELRSVRFDGWRCPKCHPEIPPTAIHIRAYVLNYRKFLNCPNCQELTVQRRYKTIKPATISKKGEESVTEKCNCCSYSHTTIQVIPSRGSNDSNGYTDGGTGGGSYGDSGGFGGGDCGGGGAGGGW